MNNIEELLNDIKLSLNIPLDELKKPSIPAALVYTGSLQKTGISPSDIAKDIILGKANAGAPIGALPDGSESIDEKMEYIRIKTIIEHFIKNAVFQVSIPPGTRIQGYGVGADGVPVKVDGITIEFSTGYAILT